MNLTVKIDQQQNALLLNFFMFIAMTLVVIRTGIIARGLPTFYPSSPFCDDEVDAYLARDDEYGVPPGRGPPSADPSDHLDRLYATAQTLLYAAELVARQLAVLGCAIFELMKLADVLAKSLRKNDAAIAGWRRPPRKRLDAP